VSGANPASSIPDSRRIAEALRSLDLLVAVEPYMTVTARLSHYVIPPKMQYERADLPLSIPGYPLFPVSWAQFTPPLLRTPEGSDVCDDWYPFWAIAKRLGIAINYVGKEFLPLDRAPITEDLLAIRLHGARVSLDELRRYPSGKIFDVQTCFVQEAPEGSDGKFDLMPDDVAAELTQFLAMTVWAGHIVSHGRTFTHLLSTRRLRDVFNSNGPQLSQIKRRMPYNPAYLCSSDLAGLDLKAGDEVMLESDHAEVKAVVGVDDAVRPGVISIAYGWGGLPDDAADKWDGAANVNLLIACDRDVESANAMPRMSAVPVNIRRL
jgi:anaerobic selenocysteine-containing dehydrogenase